MTQLYYLPNEDRVITRTGLETEIECIGHEYCASWIIDDMIDAGIAVELSADDPKAADAEPEERTVLVAKLFAEMICHIDVMAEWEDDEMALLEELRESDDSILEYYKYFYELQDV